MEGRLSESWEAANAEEAIVDTLDRRITSLKQAEFHEKSRVVKECLNHRSELSADAIRKDYTKTLQEMGRDTQSFLNVFCVAV